jgi:hypothetical protein
MIAARPEPEPHLVDRGLDIFWESLTEPPLSGRGMARAVSVRILRYPVRLRPGLRISLLQEESVSSGTA